MVHALSMNNCKLSVIEDHLFNDEQMNKQISKLAAILSAPCFLSVRAQQHGTLLTRLASAPGLLLASGMLLSPGFVPSHQTSLPISFVDVSYI